MKTYLSITIASILALSVPGIAKAQLSVTASIGGIPTVSGASSFTLETFNESTPSILTLSGSAFVATGGSSGAGLYTQPYFSGSTAAYFGEAPTVGFDTTPYVVVQPGGSATLSFSSPQHYLGLLWGTVDGQNNTLSFYGSSHNLIGSVLGSQLPGVNQLDAGPNGTTYVNINSTSAFSSVVATSGAYSFEFDDVAYAPVPEPASCVLLSAGLCALGFVLRRKSA
jgi:hypothetical protein